VAANIFPGDMLWKNFGITRHGKVVFYDYDEIEYITDCNFRRVPAPRNEEDEMSGEIWYSVGPHGCVPRNLRPLPAGQPRVREVFMQHHADLLDVAFWQSTRSASRRAMCTMCFPTNSQARFAAAHRRPAGGLS
jgi:isocitrate dehydrogenase kinase/phosphatase